MAVMRAVHGVLAYSPGSTHVRTTATEALTSGRGVCQDFAHLMIAACRGLGLPARYVSGYVFSPARGTAAASHAWTDVRPGPRLDLARPDPRVGPDRPLRARGDRTDYADVPPTRGVYKGAGREAMEVDVRVEKG